MTGITYTVWQESIGSSWLQDKMYYISQRKKKDKQKFKENKIVH